MRHRREFINNDVLHKEIEVFLICPNSYEPMRSNDTEATSIFGKLGGMLLYGMYANARLTGVLGHVPIIEELPKTEE